MIILEKKVKAKLSRKAFPFAICVIFVLLLAAVHVGVSEAANISSLPDSVMVNPATQTSLETNLTLSVPSSIFDKTVTLNAVLTDENGNPVRNASVKFEVYGKIEYSKVKWTNVSQTDGAGQVSTSYVAADMEGFRVQALFNGTEDYAASLSESRSVNVYPPIYVFYLVAIVAVTVVVGLVIGVGELMDRKKRAATQEKPNPSVT